MMGCRIRVSLGQVTSQPEKSGGICCCLKGTELLKGLHVCKGNIFWNRWASGPCGRGGGGGWAAVAGGMALCSAGKGADVGVRESDERRGCGGTHQGLRLGS